MTRQPGLDGLAQNLLLLAESFDSISSFCSKVGVNRQQFNKYLAARHLPSQKVLFRIAKYFHMEVDDLAKDPEEFRRFYEGLDDTLPDIFKLPYLRDLALVARGNESALARYRGLYFGYHCSSTVKGKVLRSVTSIFEKDGLTQYVTVERFPPVEGARATGFSFVFRGICIMLGDRLFMIDAERRHKNELTFSILVPQHRTPARFLYGVFTGVVSTASRLPFSTRLVLAKDSNAPLSRKHLRRAALLEMDSPEVPPEVRAYLSAIEDPLLIGGDA